MSPFVLSVNGGRRGSGFTLVEMMVVVGIVAILAVAAVPNFSGMLAEQRVRSAASEIMSDLVVARTEAIKQQRRVCMQAAAVGGWVRGWQIVVDSDGNGVCGGADTVVKSFNGFGSRTMLIATTGGGFFTNDISFRGDGTVLNALGGAEAGLTITDGVPLKTRNILLSPVGRATITRP